MPFDEGVARSPGDVTSRARIRDAARVELAEHGFKATTTEGIASAAGVSTGPRHACDDPTVARACQQLDDPVGAGVMAAMYPGTAVLQAPRASRVGTSLREPEGAARIGVTGDLDRCAPRERGKERSDD